MAFQVSPGVQVKEIDLTNVVPATSASIGAYAGEFNWGPIEEIRLISSEKELINTFGQPKLSDTNKNQLSFYTAASFLKYGSALQTIRSGSTEALNATTDTGLDGLLIKNRQAFESVTVPSGSDACFAAKYAGVLGNSLSISIAPAGAVMSGVGAWEYAKYFSDTPGTSDSAVAAGNASANDEVHIVVVDKNGAFTGIAGSILETFGFVSLASNAFKSDGTSNYYVNVLNQTSKYVWWLSHPTDLSANAGSPFKVDGSNVSFITSGSGIVDQDFAGGVDTITTAGDISDALDLFNDPENIDISLIFATPDVSGEGEVTLATKLRDIAEARKDCLAFVSPPLTYTTTSSDPTTDVVTWASVGPVPSSSYVVIDSGAVKMYDKYNDVYIWVGASGHMAGLCAKTDQLADAWFSPAGLNRGGLLGVTKLAYNPNQAQRDELFKARINPIVSFPGQGILLYGDKTALARPSAFDAINVRRLFITLEKSIARAARAQLFELNDEFTRAAFRNATEPFLRTVQGRRGITDFKVVCDETNNTGDIIDRNEFVADIYIKPARAIRGITLNFIATRTGVSFNEITA